MSPLHDDGSQSNRQIISNSIKFNFVKYLIRSVLIEMLFVGPAALKKGDFMSQDTN